MVIVLCLDGARPLAARRLSPRISYVITVRDKGTVLSNILSKGMAIDHL